MSYQVTKRGNAAINVHTLPFCCCRADFFITKSYCGGREFEKNSIFRSPRGAAAPECAGKACRASVQIIIIRDPAAPVRVLCTSRECERLGPGCLRRSEIIVTGANASARVFPFRCGVAFAIGFTRIWAWSSRMSENLTSNLNSPFAWDSCFR